MATLTPSWHVSYVSEGLWRVYGCRIGRCMMAAIRGIPGCCLRSNVAEENYVAQDRVSADPVVASSRRADSSVSIREFAMRWVCWIFAVAVVAIMATAIIDTETFAAGPACGEDVAYGGVAHYPNCGRSNCGSPRYGSWLYGSTSPDCCECQPSTCDNAWATFCDEKARWKAYWHQVGTPKPSTKRCWLPWLGRPTQATCQSYTTEIQSGDGIPTDAMEIPEASPDQPQLDPQAGGRIIPLPPVPQPLPEITTWRNAVWLR